MTLESTGRISPVEEAPRQDRWLREGDIRQDRCKFKESDLLAGRGLTAPRSNVP
jgi:hypothetical protein